MEAIGKVIRSASKPIVVGIGGASCSGKSTTAKALHQHYQCKSPIICQDIHATNPLSKHVMPPIEESGQSITWLNWESLDTINIDSFVQAVNAAVEDAKSNGDKIVVVEGFLIFADPRMAELFDCKVFIHIDKDTCYVRRVGRGTDTPDQYAGSEETKAFCDAASSSSTNQHNQSINNCPSSEVDTQPILRQDNSPWLKLYFEELIWPYYLRYKNVDSNDASYLHLDGALPRDSVVDSIKAYLECSHPEIVR